MRLFFVIVLGVILNSTLSGQEYILPKIDLAEESAEIDSLYNTFRIKDTKAFIVKIRSSNYWFKGSYLDLVVYKSNGKVILIRAFQNLKGKVKIKERERLNMSKSRSFHSLLESAISNKLTLIDKDKLNIKKKPTDGNSVKFISVNDGTNYTVTIIQGHAFSQFSTYAPKIYIENQFPGYQQRQMLVDIIEEYGKLLAIERPR